MIYKREYLIVEIMVLSVMPYVMSYIIIEYSNIDILIHLEWLRYI